MKSVYTSLKHQMMTDRVDMRLLCFKKKKKQQRLDTIKRIYDICEKKPHHLDKCVYTIFMDVQILKLFFPMNLVEFCLTTCIRYLKVKETIKPDYYFL